MTATPIPDSNNIRVEWTPAGVRGSRGSSDVTWRITAFVEGVPSSKVEEFVSSIGNATQGSHELSLNASYPDWTVEVRGHNDVGLGGAGRTTVTIGTDSISLSLSPAGVVENHEVPDITITATVVLANRSGTLSGPLTVLVNVDDTSTATATDDYSIPAANLPLEIVIPDGASHNDTETATLTGLTLVADDEDDADETIVFAGTIAGSSIPVSNANLIIYRPIATPDSPEVLASTPGLPANHWRIQWEEDTINSFLSYDVIVTRYENETTEFVMTENTTDDEIDVPVSDPNPNHQWAADSLQFMRGEAFKITIQGNARTPAGTVKSAPSDPVFFGVHPAPEVQAAAVTGRNISVSWTPTAVTRRGGSDVMWVITASATGANPVREEVNDTGPNESNQGSTTLDIVDKDVANWTVTVRARNAAGLGLPGQDTVNLNEVVGLDVTGDGLLTEEDGQAIHWVISTPATYGDGPSPDCGNTCFPTADQTGRVAQVRRGLRSFITNTEYADLKALVDRVYEARAASDVFDVTGDDLFTEEDGQAIHWVISTPATYGDGPSPDCGNTCFPAANQTGRVAQVRRGLRSFLTSTEYADLKALVDKVFALATSSSQ